jgi:hypothetical protein
MIAMTIAYQILVVNFKCISLATDRKASEVYKVAWWMGHYGHSSPKRHKAFTNNRWCAKFNLGKLNCKKFKASQDPNQEKPTRRYVDSKGKARYVGTKKLKSTQRLGW